MTKQKKAMILAISLIVLLMGVGYAALSNVSIYINGSASATANEANFKIGFMPYTGTPIKATGTTDDATATVQTITEGDQTATVTFTGLKKINDQVSVVIPVKNISELDISAKSVTPSVETKKDGSTTTGLEVNKDIDDYISVSTERCNEAGDTTVDPTTVLAKDAVTYVKVTAKLLKETPVDDIVNVYQVKITAVPEDANV